MYSAVVVHAVSVARPSVAQIAGDILIVSSRK